MRSWITSLVLAALLPVAAAGSEDESRQPTVTVNGRATVEVEPDRAILRVGVETQRETAREAQSETNRVGHAILAALEELGVPATAVQTSSLNLNPVYTQRRPTGEAFVPKVVGYRADNTVQVTLQDLDKVGPAIDGAIAAGGNRILGVSFGLRDDSAAQKAAMKAAVADAVTKAETIAAALGRSLASVVEAREGGVSVRPVAATRVYAEMAADAGAPVATGQVSISASVTLVYALAD